MSDHRPSGLVACTRRGSKQIEHILVLDAPDARRGFRALTHKFAAQATKLGLTDDARDELMPRMRTQIVAMAWDGTAANADEATLARQSGGLWLLRELEADNVFIIQDGDVYTYHPMAGHPAYAYAPVQEVANWISDCPDTTH